MKHQDINPWFRNNYTLNEYFFVFVYLKQNISERSADLCFSLCYPRYKYKSWPESSSYLWKVLLGETYIINIHSHWKQGWGGCSWINIFLLSLCIDRHKTYIQNGDRKLLWRFRPPPPFLTTWMSCKPFFWKIQLSKS